MPDHQEKYKPPIPSTADHAHAAGRILFALTPYVGGALVEAFTTALQIPLDRRRQLWMQEVADGLIALEAKQPEINIESLTQNDIFVSSVVRATRMAISEHNKEKLDCLRNAVLNCVYFKEEDDSLISYFLTLVNELTPLHIRMLHFLSDIKSFLEQIGVYPKTFEHSGAKGEDYRVDDIIKPAFPEFDSSILTYKMIIRDLDNRRLTDNALAGGGQGSPPIIFMHGPLTPDRKRLSDLGYAFLEFIRAPSELR